MRISAVDGLLHEDDWEDLAEFIQLYGGDLFHASQLTLGNVRAILHNGIDWYLDYLEEEQDLLRPMRLLEDLDAGTLDRADAEVLSRIYRSSPTSSIASWNTTRRRRSRTTERCSTASSSSLRVEARYDRDSWNMQPVTPRPRDALLPRPRRRRGTVGVDLRGPDADLAEQHLKDLRQLQTRFGMRMPTRSSTT